MKIAGYLKTSLIEWPGKIASVIFVSGCNFRCPFCHNADLADPKKWRRLRLIPEREIFEDLKKRKKWVDGVVFSVYGDEPVVMKNKDGELFHLPIKEIWNLGREEKKLTFPITHEVRELKRIKCLTNNGFKDTCKILRHKARSLYKVVCGPGNYAVLTTGSHSLFTVTKEGLKPKKVDKLKRGEWLLSPNKINSRKRLKEINLLDYTSCLDENRSIRQKKIDYWGKIVSQVGPKTISQLSREYGHQRKTIREYCHSFKNNFSSLLDEWVVEDGFIRHKTSNCKIPIKLEVTSDFGEFLGYAVAEGSAKRENKSISSYTFALGDEPKLARRILELYQKIFKQKSGVVRRIKARTGNWQYQVILGNKVIGELVENLVGNGFLNKHTPQIIFNVSNDIKISFIKALIAGDGHERIRKNHSQHEFSLKTGSRKLASDFIFLLRTMGIFSWIEEDGNYFRLVASQNDLGKLNINLGLDLKYRFKTRIDGIPRKLLDYSLRGQKRILKEELAIWKTLPLIKNKKRKALAVRHGLLDSKGRVTKKGKQLLFLLNLSENWDFKEVKKVEKIQLGRPEYVYDLVVKGNHSFVGGIGGLLLHNTGGEPSCQPDLSRFLNRVKKMGFLTMIETNGSQPEVLRKLFKGGLLDRITVDIKGPLDEYFRFTNVRCPVSNIKSSIEAVAGSGREFEFRTTVVPGLHDEGVLAKMAEQLKSFVQGAETKRQDWQWYLQNFQPKNCLDREFEKRKPFNMEEMERFLKVARKIIPEAEARGV